MRCLYIDQVIRLPAKEGPARRGQYHFLHFTYILTGKALKDSRMFAIHGCDHSAFCASTFHHELAGHNKCFLVRQRYPFASVYRRKNGMQARKTQHSAKNRIDRFPLHHFSKRFMSRKYLYRQHHQGFLYFLILRLVGNHHRIGLEPSCLLNEQGGIAMRT